jgi:hypothetical protein
MSTILYKKLNSELFQNRTLVISDERIDRIHIAAFCPYILMVGNPSGTLTFSVETNSVEIFSQDFTSADIRLSLNTTDNYAHVFYPIAPTNPIQLGEGDYVFKLTSSYTPTELSHFGWIQQYEDIQTDTNYTISSDDQNPLAMRIKLYV